MAEFVSCIVYGRNRKRRKKKGDLHASLPAKGLRVWENLTRSYSGWSYFICSRYKNRVLHGIQGEMPTKFNWTSAPFNVSPWFNAQRPAIRHSAPDFPGLAPKRPKRSLTLLQICITSTQMARFPGESLEMETVPPLGQCHDFPHLAQ